MKSVIGAVLAAVVGIHCSGPVDDSDSSSSDLVSTPTPAANATPHHSANDDLAAPKPTYSTGFGQLLHGGAPVVTSTVTDDTGTSYVTGTFEGTVVFGTTSIKSKGDKDVFLMKLSPGGEMAWVRAIGSGEEEMSPKLTLESGAKLTVVGVTKGKMDCGSGPLQEWSSETFFVCTFGGADGTPLSGGVFPTGTP